MTDLHDLRYRLARLQMAHRDLDDKIVTLEKQVSPDIILIRRLKREKLSLREQIQKIEDQLIPNIIA